MCVLFLGGDFGGSSVSPSNWESERKRGRRFFGGPWFDFKAFRRRLALDPRLEEGHSNRLEIKQLIDQRADWMVYIDMDFNVRWASRIEPASDEFKRLFARFRNLDAENISLPKGEVKLRFAILTAHCLAGLLAEEPTVITEARLANAELMFSAIRSAKKPLAAIPPKVFVSYSHDDAGIASKLRTTLGEHGIEVVIDTKTLAGGENIADFIENAVSSTNATVCLISRSSLLSAWVAMEAVTSFFHTKFVQPKKFVGCYVEDSFFRRDFVDLALDHVDGQIANLRGLIEGRLQRDRGFRDLQGELDRNMTLRSNLDDIVRRLRETKCIDLRPKVFDENIPVLVEALRL